MGHFLNASARLTFLRVEHKMTPIKLNQPPLIAVSREKKMVQKTNKRKKINTQNDKISRPF